MSTISNDDVRDGILALRDGKPAAALQFFDSAQKESGTDIRVLLPKAHAFRMLGRKDDALETLRTAASVAPTNPDVMFALADALLAYRSNSSEAEELLRSLLKAQLPPQSSIGLRSRHRLSQLLFDQNRFSDAREVLRECIDAGELNSTILSNLGAVELALGDLPAAYDALSKSMKQHAHPTTAFNLANVCVELNRLDEAESLYKNCLAADPDDAQLNLNIGMLYEQRGKWTDAEPHLRVAVESESSGFSSETFVEASVALANVYERLNNRNAVKKVLDGVRLKHQGDAAELECHLGNLLWERSQAELAKLCYESSLTKNPDFAVAHLNLGQLLFRALGSPEQGLAHMERAVELDPALADHLKRQSSSAHQHGHHVHGPNCNHDHDQDHHHH